MSAPVSPTSSAARTTAACRAAGSATMTTTAGTTQTRRAAVGPRPTLPHPAQQAPSPRGPRDLPPQHSCPHHPWAALGQTAASQGGGQEPLPPHPTPCRVFEFVPFHLISCFSPFSHCPLGVTEVGVSDVLCSHHTPASAPEPAHPCAAPQPIVLYWPLPKP